MKRNTHAYRLRPSACHHPVPNFGPIGLTGFRRCLASPSLDPHRRYWHTLAPHFLPWFLLVGRARRPSLTSIAILGSALLLLRRRELQAGSLTRSSFYFFLDSRFAAGKCDLSYRHPDRNASCETRCTIRPFSSSGRVSFRIKVHDIPALYQLIPACFSLSSTLSGETLAPPMWEPLRV